jgi:hypothetical protein
VGVQIKDVVTDMRYHSADVAVGLGERGIRSYLPGPDRSLTRLVVHAAGFNRR